MGDAGRRRRRQRTRGRPRGGAPRWPAHRAAPARGHPRWPHGCRRRGSRRPAHPPRAASAPISRRRDCGTDADCPGVRRAGDPQCGDRRADGLGRIGLWADGPELGGRHPPYRLGAAPVPGDARARDDPAAVRPVRCGHARVGRCVRHGHDRGCVGGGPAGRRLRHRPPGCRRCGLGPGPPGRCGPLSHRCSVDRAPADNRARAALAADAPRGTGSRAHAGGCPGSRRVLCPIRQLGPHRPRRRRRPRGVVRPAAPGAGSRRRGHPAAGGADRSEPHHGDARHRETMGCRAECQSSCRPGIPGPGTSRLRRAFRRRPGRVRDRAARLGRDRWLARHDRGCGSASTGDDHPAHPDPSRRAGDRTGASAGDRGASPDEVHLFPDRPAHDWGVARHHARHGCGRTGPAHHCPRRAPPGARRHRRHRPPAGRSVGRRGQGGPRHPPGALQPRHHRHRYGYRRRRGGPLMLGPDIPGSGGHVVHALRGLQLPLPSPHRG